jgi:hypothetical protein
MQRDFDDYIIGHILSFVSEHMTLAMCMQSCRAMRNAANCLINQRYSAESAVVEHGMTQMKYAMSVDEPLTCEYQRYKSFEWLMHWCVNMSLLENPMQPPPLKSLLVRMLRYNKRHSFRFACRERAVAANLQTTKHTPHPPGAVVRASKYLFATLCLENVASTTRTLVQNGS